MKYPFAVRVLQSYLGFRSFGPQARGAIQDDISRSKIQGLQGYEEYLSWALKSTKKTCIELCATVGKRIEMRPREGRFQRRRGAMLLIGRLGRGWASRSLLGPKPSTTTWSPVRTFFILS